LRDAQRGVVHLRAYSSEYLVVGQGEPLVLIPGLAGGHELTYRLVNRLASKFRVICFELRGEHEALLGRCAHTMADLAGDLADFLDAMVLERPLLAGVSFGSAVALQFALAYPHRPRALVLHGLEGHFRDSLGGRIARMVLEQYPLPHDNPFLNQFFRLLFAGPESPGPLLDYVAARCWSTDQSVIANRLSLLWDFDVRHRLHTLRVPTLVVAGAEDVIVSATSQKALALALPESCYVSLPHAGHLCFLTHARAFAQQVALFHQRVGQPVET
jgi:pimeloyl-ACP methyl ester carboxylesterase